MQSTPVSLLERLHRPGEQAAWIRFVQLHTPLLYHWARRTGLQESDASDLVQDVLTTMVQKLPEFSYDREKSFRGWLRTILVNRWRDLRRRRAARPMTGQDELLARTADESGPELLEEAEYRTRLVNRALE